VIDNKEDWKREEKIEEDHRKIEEMVPRKFLKWRKVFGKVESERMPTRKVWDHTINLKETITNGHLLFVMGALILKEFKNAKLDK